MYYRSFPACGLFAALYLLVCLSPLMGQELPLSNYRIADGLISNNVNDICQDSLGFIWIATSEGLSRFDSKEFRNYTTNDGLSANNVACLSADPFVPGDVWIGLYGKGVNRFHDGKFEQYIVGTARYQETVNDLCQDSTGRVWCGTDRGLYYIVDQHNALSFPWLSGVHVYAATVTPSGRVLVGTSSGAYYLDGVVNPPVPFDCPVLRTIKPSAFFIDSRNNLWVLSTTGRAVVCINCDPKKTFVRDCAPGLLGISEDQYHQVWIGSSRGLIVTTANDFKHGRFRRYDKENGLPDNVLDRVMADREGMIWVSSYRAGLISLAGTDLIRFRFAQREDRMWSSAVVDQFGHFWVTDGVSLFEIFRNVSRKWTMTIHPIISPGPHDQLMKIVYDSTVNTLVCAFGQGRVVEYRISHRDSRVSLIKMIGNVNLRKYSRFTFLQTAFVDAAGRLWCSLLDRGVAVLNRDLSGIARIYGKSDGLPDVSVRAFDQAADGSMWLGGFDHGLAVLPGMLVQHDLTGAPLRGNLKPVLYTTDNGLPDNGVRAFAQLDSGEMLIGTRYGGLALLRGDSITSITRENSKLMSDGIWSVCPLSPTRILLCTQAGVEEMSLDDQIHFLRLDRVPGDPFYSSALSSEGIACFASGSDVFLYDTKDGSVLRGPLPVYLTDIFVNGNEIDMSRVTTLSSRVSTMTFKFIEVTNRMTERAYSYKLIGADLKFHTLFGENSVTYAGLGPGKYTFEVFAFNGNSRSSTPATVSFVIRTPFYATWYFILLSLGVIVSIIMMFILQRVHRFKEVRMIRQRIATDLHDEIGSGLTKIAILSEFASFERTSSVREDPNGSSPQQPDDGVHFPESATDRIGRIARGLVDSVSDVVWSIDPKYDTLDDFVFTFRSYANEIAEAKGIKFGIRADGLAKAKIGPQIKRVLQLLSKEALNNAVKYSGCRNIIYSLEIRKGRVFLTIEDDGCGFDREKVELGNGINNMEKHARQMKGSLRLESSPGNGTKIRFDFPIQIQN